MSEHWATFRGVVRNGVVEFERPVNLPDGTEVQVKVPPLEFTPEEQAEFDAWERASAEAFQMIVDLEQQDRNGRG